MAQAALDQAPVSSAGKLRAPRVTRLVKAHTLADHGGLADHDARAVVDEEAAADLGAGMDVDAGQRVGDLADLPRQEAGAELVQRMRQAVVDDRRHAGIDEQDLGMPGCGGIAGIGRAQIADQQAANPRQVGGERARDGLGLARQLVVGRHALRGERQCAAKMLAQGRQCLRQHAGDEVVDHLRRHRAIAVAEPAPELAVVGGKQGHGELPYRLDDRLARRRRPHRSAIADIVQHVARLAQPGDDRTDIDVGGRSDRKSGMVPPGFGQAWVAWRGWRFNRRAQFGGTHWQDLLRSALQEKNPLRGQPDCQASAGTNTRQRPSMLSRGGAPLEHSIRWLTIHRTIEVERPARLVHGSNEVCSCEDTPHGSARSSRTLWKLDRKFLPGRASSASATTTRGSMRARHLERPASKLGKLSGIIQTAPLPGAAAA